MSDDLENCSDVELGKLFAVEVAGWRSDPYGVFAPNGCGMFVIKEPVFCSDANEVIPWLMKERTDFQSIVIIGPYFSEAAKRVLWSCEIIDNNINQHVVGLSLSFARAAAVALLKAKRTFRADKL